MKLASLALLSLSDARKVTMVDVQRNLGGSYLESLPGYERNFNYGGFQSLTGLAMMTVFLDQSRIMQSRTNSIEGFEITIDDFLDKFTNYGCYCWILGPMRGVIGGGQVKDEIDARCGELYKCYKCLNLDHGSSTSMFEYSVNLVEHDDGSRKLECEQGENQDACRCDVMFAEKMAEVNKQCENDMNNGVQNSQFCLNEDFRTLNGGGSFDPTDNSAAGCLKINMDGHNAKDSCCGSYPDRLPFDSLNRECCRITHTDGQVQFFLDQIVPSFSCEERGGQVIET